MAEITLIVPIRSERDVDFFSTLTSAGVTLSSEKVKKLSGVEIAEALVLSIAASVAYDAGKTATKLLISKIREYFSSPEAGGSSQNIVSLNGLQYDVSKPDELDALVSDLKALADADAS